MKKGDQKTAPWVLFLRHGVPALVCLSGIVLLLVEWDINAADGAAMLLGAGGSWWLMGWLFRQGQQGDEERDVEDAARDFLDEHGRWPTDEEERRFARTGSWGPPSSEQPVVATPERSTH
jgi:hypothetical protein